MDLTSGLTTQYVPFVAVDATDLKTRETGLSGFTVYRSRNGGSLTAYTTPTIAESSSANAPGLYWLLVDEDTTISSGVNEEAYVVHISHASMAPVTLELTLKRPIVTAGQTLTVANGCADADIERVTGNAVPATSSNGVLKVDVTHYGGSAGTFASGRPETNVNSIANNAITANAIAPNAFTAAKFAAGAFDAVWSVATRLLTAGTNIVLAKGTGVTGFNDLDAAAVRSAVGLASANLDTQLSGINSKTTNLPAAPAATGDIPTANQNADALLDRANGVETGISPRAAWRIIAAACAGKASGLDTNSPKYRDLNDTKDRITATTDASGNRSAVTVDGS